jgi:hypothetical protein
LDGEEVPSISVIDILLDAAAAADSLLKAMLDAVSSSLKLTCLDDSSSNESHVEMSKAAK